MSRACVWISRDDSGRPSCEHGPARSKGQGRWFCCERDRKARLDWLANPNNKDKLQAQRSKYRKENREAIAAQTKIYRDGHRQERREWDREYWRKKTGWYDEGGMATKPTQFKEITNV